MKSTLLLLLCLLPLAGTAQSARKLNKQLKAAYAVKYHEADSIRQLHEKELALWESAKDAFYDTINRFRAQDKEYYALQDSVSSKGKNLEKLGRAPGPYVEDIRTFYRARYRVEFLISPYIERLGFLDVVLGAAVSLDSMHDLSTYDRDFQNRYLQQELESIDRFFTSAGYDRDKIAKSLVGMDTTQVNLNAVKRTINEMVPTLRSHNAYLEKELAAERQRFAKNGPKGFDEAYFEVFPDVFPPKEPDKVIYIEPVQVSEEPLDVNAPFLEEDVESESVVAPKDDVFQFVDEPAEFPGGNAELRKFIKQHLKMPALAENLALEGYSVVKFVVDLDGSISRVEVVRRMPDCSECDEEAVRLVTSMPNWTPGKINGKTVKSYFHLPVKFAL